MKIVVCVLDGIADPYFKSTPLSLAKKVNIQKILPESFCARFLPLTKKYWPKLATASISGLANLGILGYKISAERLKRGILEAIGSDIPIKKGWLAFRVDFATIDNNGKIIDRRAGRITYGLDKLAEDIQRMDLDIPFIFKRTYGHRAVLIFKSKFSPKISINDPFATGKPPRKIEPLTKDNLTLKTSFLVNKFLSLAHSLLKSHPINQKRQKRNYLPANYLLIREPGNSWPQNLKPFSKRYNFKNPIVIAENGVIKGTCKLVGFKTKTVPEIHSLKARWQFIDRLLTKTIKESDFIYIHFKELDEASHDKNPGKKKKLWEKFDIWFGEKIKKFKVKWVILGDHLTNSKNGKHAYGPVPLLIYPSTTKTEVKNFDEESLRSTKILTGEKLWRVVKRI